MDIRGKEVAVLGAGRSGRAAACLAHSLGAKVTLYDTRETMERGRLPDSISLAAGASLEKGKGIRSDLLILSPGIPTLGEFAQAFASNTGELIGETEFAFRSFKGKVIGITGTNGKTTTTEMIQHLVRDAGVSCQACGNHGMPLSEVVLLNDPPAIAALELSSFQLETMVDFRPHVAVWMNFAPDHMDRYDTLEEYWNAKARLFENQTVSDRIVFRYGERLPELSAPSQSFSSETTDADFSTDGRLLSKGEETFFDLATTKIRGKHNAENVLAAYMAVEAIGLKPDLKSLCDFNSPRHRCEWVGSLNGIDYLNDSKATNLHAMASALQSLPEQVVLIAGGKQKGLDYTPLVPLVKKHVSKAILLGEIKEELQSLFEQVTEVSLVNSMKEAVAKASQVAVAGEVVLLSPGTSSFDMYESYEARGDDFRNEILITQKNL